jgi:Fe2+ transport system protein B
MYCIECGAQIPDNSKFCSHCGKPQNEVEPSLKEKVAEKIIQNEIVRQVVQEHRRSIDYQFLKKAMGYYLAWILLHLTFLLIFSDSIFKGNSDGICDFWPLQFLDDCTVRLEEYDITEFLVYTIFPLVILVILSMVQTQSNTESN